jgi:predicted transcriptional regulator
MAKEKAISFRVSDEFVEVLERLKEITGRSQTAIIEDAVFYYRRRKVDILRQGIKAIGVSNALVY